MGVCERKKEGGQPPHPEAEKSGSKAEKKTAKKGVGQVMRERPLEDSDRRFSFQFAEKSGHQRTYLNMEQEGGGNQMQGRI